MVHLKRFSPYERSHDKVSTPIELSANGLDLSSYSAGQTPCQYNLYSVVNHRGTLSSGHYTAYCKHPHTSEWYEFNDAKVHPINQLRTSCGEAYILFFELGSGS